MTTATHRPGHEGSGANPAQAGPGPARLGRLARGAARQWPPILLLLTLLAGWEALTALATEPVRYLPPPTEVLTELLSRPGWYTTHAGATMTEAGIGFLIGGSLAGLFALIMAESSIADRALLPFFVIVKVTPPVVLTPFLVIALGFGMGPKVFLAALTLFYAMLINTLTGFKAVDEGALEVMESVDASRLEIFYRLRLPNSLPFLFSAAKIGVPLAILGAVFAEIYNSTRGLGNVIRTASEFGAFAPIWGAIYVLALVGLALIGLLSLVERRVLRWHVATARD